MVKVQEPSDHEKLDRIIQDVAARHGFRLSVDGWARKTYDVYRADRKNDRETLLARVESFATTSGEIRVFDDAALAFAQELGQKLEETFRLKEAVILRQRPPE